MPYAHAATLPHDAIEQQNRWQRRLCLLLAGALVLIIGMGQVVAPMHYDRDHFHVAVGVDNPEGFAVLVNNDGQINVVHKDGLVLVPRNKKYGP